MDRNGKLGLGSLTVLNIAGVVIFATFAPAEHALLLTAVAGVPLLVALFGASVRR